MRNKKKIYSMEYMVSTDEVVHVENAISEEVTPLHEFELCMVDQYGNYKDVVWEVILN